MDANKNLSFGLNFKKNKKKQKQKKTVTTFKPRQSILGFGNDSSSSDDDEADDAGYIDPKLIMSRQSLRNDNDNRTGRNGRHTKTATLSAKQRVARLVEQQRQQQQRQAPQRIAKAQADDPTAFAYDAVYDKLAADRSKHNAAKQEKKAARRTRPRYYEAMQKAALLREKRNDLVFERQLIRDLKQRVRGQEL